MRPHLPLIAAILLTATAASAAPVDLKAEEQELLRLVAKDRDAHLGYDPAALTAAQADGFLSVSDGRVFRSTREQSVAVFRRYFDAVHFQAWDDLAPPVVTLSDDATLATVLVQKRVRLTEKAKPDAPAQETDWAWLETWRKQDGAWRRQMIVSTKQATRLIGEPAPAGG